MKNVLLAIASVLTAVYLAVTINSCKEAGYAFFRNGNSVADNIDIVDELAEASKYKGL